MNTLEEKLEELLHIEWIAEHLDEYEFYGRTGEIRKDLEERVSMKNVYYSVLLDDVRQMAEAFDNNPFNYRTDLKELPADCVRSAIPDNYFVSWEAGGETYFVPVGFLRGNAPETERRLLTEKVHRLASDGRAVCREICSRVSGITREAVNEISGNAVHYREKIHPLCRSVRIRRIFLAAVWYLLLTAAVLNPYIKQLLRGYAGSRISFAYGRRSVSAAGRLLAEPFWLEYFPAYRGSAAERLLKIPESALTQGILSGLLLVLAAAAVVSSVHLFRRDVMNRRMKQLVRHYDSMKKSYAALEQVRQAVEDPMTDEPIRKTVRNDELRELLRLSRLRFSFRYPRRIPPASYATAYAGGSGRLVVLILLAALLLYLR